MRMPPVFGAVGAVGVAGAGAALVPLARVSARARPLRADANANPRHDPAPPARNALRPWSAMRAPAGAYDPPAPPDHPFAHVTASPVARQLPRRHPQRFRQIL